MFTVVITKRAMKQLERIPASHRDDLRRALTSLASSPFSGKKLEGLFEGRYSLRVWPYRIIYSLQKKMLLVTVIAIGHRQGVYK